MSGSDVLLRQFMTNGTARSRAFGPDYQELWASLDQASQGGKRFRPALLAAVYRALGGSDEELVGHVGAAVELLHTAFVIHDDVIDGDDTRRGRLNVSGTFAARALSIDAAPGRAAVLGRTAGILAGDLALVGASRLIALCGAAPTTTRRLLDLLDHAVYVTAAGELADVSLSIGLAPVSLGAVLTMEEHKTSVYSFELPLQAGAVLAGAPEETVLRLSELGRLLGIGFQLFDDIQGVFGDQATTGKSTLTDLREGKVTPLIAHARSTTAWPMIEPFVGDAGLSEERAGLVRELLVGCGSRRFIEELAEGYVSASLELAADLGLPQEFISWVWAITDDFARRAA
jgi:geranylgeranyl diphosphate synthase type II